MPITSHDVDTCSTKMWIGFRWEKHILEDSWPSLIIDILSPNPTVHVYVSLVCNRNCRKLSLLSFGWGEGRLGDGLGNGGKGWIWQPDFKGVNVMTVFRRR